MDKQEALDLSIEHWQRLYEARTMREFEKEGIGGRSCELCNRYRCLSKESSYACADCPVFNYTKTQNCENTPYTEVMDMKREMSHLKYAGSYTSEYCRAAPSEKLREAVKAELDFLISLRAYLE